MGFIVDKKLFLKSLTSVMPAVPTRSTLPILSGVKLGGADTRFSLEATDLELAIRLQGPARGTGEGLDCVVVPAKALAKAVKSLAGEEVGVDLIERDERPVVEVSSGKKRIALDALPASDWPEIAADIEFQAVCWFDARELADALRRIVLCASDDEARPVLTGVQFNFRGESLELVATDSYRLGILSVGVEPMKETPDWAPIVPAKTLKALAKQLKKEDGRGILYVGKSGGEDNPQRFVEFSFGTADCWLTREIRGEFPNWRQIVPEEAGGTFEFASEEIAEAVKGAAALRSQKSVPVRVSLGDRCVVRMAESQVANVAETLETAAYSPNGVGPMEIAFNPDFLLDGITFVGEEKVRMRASDPLKPALFLGDNGGRYVLMPVRLSALDPLDPLFPLYKDLWKRDGYVSHTVVRYRDRRGRVRLVAESWAPGWLVPDVLKNSEIRSLDRWLARRASSLQVKKFYGVWDEIFDVFRERKRKTGLFDLFYEPRREEGDPYRFRTALYFDGRLVLAQNLVQPNDSEPLRWRWCR